MHTAGRFLLSSKAATSSHKKLQIPQIDSPRCPCSDSRQYCVSAACTAFTLCGPGDLEVGNRVNFLIRMEKKAFCHGILVACCHWLVAQSGPLCSWRRRVQWHRRANMRRSEPGPQTLAVHCQDVHTCRIVIRLLCYGVTPPPKKLPFWFLRPKRASRRTHKYTECLSKFQNKPLLAFWLLFFFACSVAFLYVLIWISVSASGHLVSHRTTGRPCSRAGAAGVCALFSTCRWCCRSCTRMPGHSEHTQVLEPAAQNTYSCANSVQCNPTTACRWGLWKGNKNNLKCRQWNFWLINRIIIVIIISIILLKPLLAVIVQRLGLVASSSLGHIEGKTRTSTHWHNTHICMKCRICRDA